MDSVTALIQAAANGHKEVCDLLISRGCSVDLQNKDGRTALIAAATAIPLEDSPVEDTPSVLAAPTM